MRLHHVQVTCPPGGEDAARRFYADGLGLTEVPRPEGLAGRALCWFRDFDEDGRTTAEIHVGVEDPFTPARKAHPALVADDVAHLESIGARLEELGYEITWKDRHTFDGYERFHAFDGAGNRVEVLTPVV
ncbi:VOC family protein [Promicromonospora soli]|uniref:VOC family protein n=1 Tax=Promicromonospora soli TaxID=2035533 RepID=UPI001678FF4E|nr:VOC family protein [Promicromonospora soli]